MKCIIQSISNGRLSVTECPAPAVRPGHVLIANTSSLISAGTEKSAMELAGRSLLGKARQRPDQVRRVLEKIRNEGLLNTVRAVREKLDNPMSMGYSSAGVVLACGTGVEQFKPGDRVASNGNHAEVVCVPKNLCASIPENVSTDHGAFAVLGAIALHGIRHAQIDLGSTVFIIGLGLTGQLAVSLLNASGCHVIGTDPDVSKCVLAKNAGAAFAEPEISASQIDKLTGGMGADAVLITASTRSNDPIELAARAVRKRGRVVLVGVVGLELDRRPFYFKEAEFVVSCSYGPGRYDPGYEELGRDYPPAYVRWTEQRNISAVLQAMSAGKLEIEQLISHRFKIEDAARAYNIISSGSEPFLGVLLQYDADKNKKPDRTIQLKPRLPQRKRVSKGGETTQLGVGVLGAGNFANMILIPQIVACDGLTPVVLCSAGGVHATHSGRKYGFQRASSDENEVLAANDVDLVFSLTQHHLHGDHVVKAIRAGKSIFVEKPLCLNLDNLLAIEHALLESRDATPLVMVGFNRRFAPLAQRLKSVFADLNAPLTISYRFNAGSISVDHWTQQTEIGGGRIIGEACHAIDFATWLTGSLPTRVYAESVGGETAPEITDDQTFITIRHQNGSVSSIAYLAGGDKACPKERVEIFGGGATAVLDDFRRLTVYNRGKKTVRKHQQDKGHAAEIRRFTAAVNGTTEPPISWDQIRSTTITSILAVQSLREGMPFTI